MAQKYEVKDNHELIKLMDKYDARDVDQLEYNEAIIYELSNGKIILAPSIGPEGILFHDRSELERMLASKHFPVRGEGGMFEGEQAKLGNREALLASLPVFKDTLEKALKMPINLDGSAEHLDQITKRINIYGRNAFRERYIMELGAVFGEMVRRKIDGEWTFDKQYTMNPYYIPSVSARDGMGLVVWRRVSERFELHSEDVPFSLREVAYRLTNFALMKGPVLDPATWKQAQRTWE